MSELDDKVIDIIVEELGVERDKVNKDASFMEDLGADSLDTVELVMAFEKEFDVAATFTSTSPTKNWPIS